MRKNNTHDQGLGFGLSFVGIVGWSVVIPTLAGTFAGRWLDAHHPAPHSWTLTLLFTGLTLGVFTAWRWLERQRREIKNTKEKR
jgi:ATP synthase protein I